MKYLLIPFAFLFTSFSLPNFTECDISDVYKAIETGAGTVALVNDEAQEIEFVLVPIKVDDGMYSVSVTRKGKNIYKVEGQNIYLRTKYCYEYSFGDKAIISLTNGFYKTTGTITFK